jgi:hypothetical protein
MQIMDLDQIANLDAEVEPEEFQEWMTRHEIHHRSFYRQRAVIDVAILNFAVNLYLEVKPIKNEDFRINHLLKYNAPRSHRLLLDIDPLLDAFFAYEIANWRSIFDDTSDCLVASVLALSVVDQHSRLIYKMMEWLFEKSLELCGKAPIVPRYVMSYSLSRGLYPFLRNTNEAESPYPREIFWAVSNTIRDLYESNKKQASHLFTMIGRRNRTKENSEKIRLDRELQTEFQRFNPGIDVELWLSRRDERTRSDFENQLLYQILGYDISKMGRKQLIQQGPMLNVIKHGDEILVQVRPGVKNMDSVYSNLTLTHAQDCLIAGCEPNCFLCKCRLQGCTNNPSNHQYISNFSNEIKAAFDPYKS